MRHLTGTLDVFVVYGANARHTNLVGLIDSDHESDMEIRRSLVVGLVQSLLQEVMHSEVWCQVEFGKYGDNDMHKHKFKLFLD